ncbi:MAG: hypothetical protein ACI4EH_03200 [Oliverpabstia sp.]
MRYEKEIGFSMRLDYTVLTFWHCTFLDNASTIDSNKRNKSFFRANNSKDAGGYDYGKFIA